MNMFITLRQSAKKMLAELTDVCLKVGGLSLISFRVTSAFPIVKRPLGAPSMSLISISRKIFSVA